MYVLDHKNNVHDIKESDITYIYVLRPNIYYRTNQGKFRAPRTITDFKKIYERFGFVLIDKKKIVNLNHVNKFENGYVYFDDCKYPVSRRNIPKVKEMLDRINHN